MRSALSSVATPAEGFPSPGDPPQGAPSSAVQKASPAAAEASAATPDAVADRAVDDLTARARIRDAAILQFARHGFSASIRAIAADAAVSPALVIHHFGSKAGLRAECDEYVSQKIRDIERENVAGASGPMNFLSAMNQLDEYAPLMGYTIRSLQSGGEMAQSFLGRIADDAYDYIREGVEAGTIVPSRDESARAKYVVAVSLGPLLVDLAVNPPDDPADLRGLIDDHLQRIALPAMELFTEGFMADRSLLDSYLEYLKETGHSGNDRTHAPPS